MNPDTPTGYRLVPRNHPTNAPDLHEYLTEANDLCKSGLMVARSVLSEVLENPYAKGQVVGGTP